MDLSKKKVLIIPLDDALTERGSVTQICVRRELLDRIRRTNLSRVIITYKDDDDKDFYVKIKTVEFFVFAYCRIAVRAYKDSDALLEEVTESLPHSIKRKENFLFIGERKGVDSINLNDFIND